MRTQFIPNRKVGLWALFAMPLFGLYADRHVVRADEGSEPLKSVSDANPPRSESDAPSAAIGWNTEWLVQPSNGRLLHGVQGAASCAASGCHGGPQVAVAAADAPRGSEYPLWVENDPHARSWQTLNSAASIEILSRLSILKDGQIVAPEAYQNCLACHNTARTLLADGISPTLTEGVGCEACHGPAEKWSSEHFQSPSSVRRSRAELGLVDLEPLVQRAKACTLCHVGGPDRDMNHDIIAAGHPALYFDMAVYHEAYPKHWRDANGNAESFRAQLWLAGQLAQADSELELIASRASRSHSVSVWPEFSNYQCTSCHQRLDGSPHAISHPAEPSKSDRPNHPVANSGLADTGLASTRQWNLHGIRALLEATQPTPENRHPLSPLRDALQNLETAMQSPTANSLEQAKAIANAAECLRSELAWVALASNESQINLLAPVPWTADDQRRWAAKQLRLASQALEWESAAMTYVAVWAALPSIPDPDAGRPSLRRHMQTFRRGLLFSDRSQSPVFPRIESDVSTPSHREWSDALSHLLRELGEPLQ